VLGNSLEPLADVGHSFSEAAIEYKGEGNDEGGESSDVCNGESVANKEGLSLEVRVEDLDLLLDAFDCVIVLRKVEGHAEGVVGDLASVGPVAGRGD
jgi:hypothetical protein